MTRDKKRKLFKVEYYRKKYGFTQKDFGDFLGIKQGSYSHKVRGKSEFTLTDMLILRDVLNRKAWVEENKYLTLDELFGD